MPTIYNDLSHFHGIHREINLVSFINDYIYLLANIKDHTALYVGQILNEKN